MTTEPAKEPANPVGDRFDTAAEEIIRNALQAHQLPRQITANLHDGIAAALRNEAIPDVCDDALLKQIEIDALGMPAPVLRSMINFHRGSTVRFSARLKVLEARKDTGPQTTDAAEGK
jgi:hypothetical protein